MQAIASKKRKLFMKRLEVRNSGKQDQGHHCGDRRGYYRA